MTDVELREPLAHECDTLTELCIRSKAVWGYGDAFMELCRPELTITPAQIDAHFVRCAISKEVIIGVVELVVDGTMTILEKLFVDPDTVGSGIGRQLLDMAQLHALASGATQMEIDADPGAVSFYERLGAKRVGEVESESIAGRMLPRLMPELA